MRIRKVINFLRRGKPKQSITFVDLGCGEGGRTPELALLHPNKRFVAVDKKPLHPVMNILSKKLPNLEFVQADALKYLKRMPNHSIKIINVDFSGITSQEMLHIPAFARKEYINLTKSFFINAKRVLTPNGRLYITTGYITTGKSDLSEVLELIKNSGFNTSYQKISELSEKKRLTTTTRTLKAYQDHDEKHYRIEARPIRKQTKRKFLKWRLNPSN